MIDVMVRKVTRKALKSYDCAACPDPILLGEQHDCYYFGRGLGSKKFPDRVHINCGGKTAWLQKKNVNL